MLLQRILGFFPDHGTNLDLAIWGKKTKNKNKKPKNMFSLTFTEWQTVTQVRNITVRIQVI